MDARPKPISIRTGSGSDRRPRQRGLPFRETCRADPRQWADQNAELQLRELREYAVRHERCCYYPGVIRPEPDESAVSTCIFGATPPGSDSTSAHDSRFHQVAVEIPPKFASRVETDRRSQEILTVGIYYFVIGQFSRASSPSSGSTWNGKPFPCLIATNHDLLLWPPCGELG